LSRVLKELDARLADISESGPNIWATLTVGVLLGSASGRYFLTVKAESGNETTTREIALDITPLDVAPDRR
jgi:hypothetical protein